jgi:methylase of polypeptide subunit release factors
MTSRVWLDVGRGTGALSQGILERNAPTRIVGVDLSENFERSA